MSHLKIDEPRYMVIMKGAKFDLYYHFGIRGMSVTFHSEGDGNVTGHTNASPDELNKWMCEPPNRVPFPTGSLLFWQPVFRLSVNMKEIPMERKEGNGH